jgi:hypothetical protein
MASNRAIRRPAVCSPTSRRRGAAVTRDSRGPRGRSGWGSVVPGRSITWPPRPGRCCAPSSQTASSRSPEYAVTGVTWIDGELWHGTWEGNESELRRVDPRTGEILESLQMPPGMGVSGLEPDGADQFSWTPRPRPGTIPDAPR